MKKAVVVLLIVIFAAAGLALGYYLGKDRGVEQAEGKLQPLINSAYPAPPNVLYALTGIVKNITGATITLEIVSLDDYLPHLDGSPRKKEMRFAAVSSETKFAELNYALASTDGSPKITSLTLAEIPVGERVKVISNENIREAEKFDVRRVEVVRY